MTLMVPGVPSGASGGFSLGASGAAADPAMGKSLDEIISDRRKSQRQASKHGPKKTAAADRAVGTGRAKREAAMKARRGMTETKKPDAMAVDREVYRQSRQTATAKAVNEKKATGGRLPPNSTTRRNRKKKEDGPKAFFGGVQPSKKAVAAAVTAMKKEGFTVPEGMQVVITIAPGAQKAKGPKNPANDNKGGAGGKGKKPAGDGKQNTKPKGGGRRKG